MKTNRRVSTRNARVTLMSSFLADLAFILPIWILFGTEELGLSTTMTTVLFMTIWIGSGLLEVPTGALADRLGRKRVYLIGVALMMLYPVAYIYKLPVPAIFVLSAISALGSAMRSGTMLALTNVSYKQDGRSDKEYHSFLSSELTVIFIARALSGVCGGLLYATDPRAPYVACLITYALMLLVGTFAADVGERSSLTNRLHIRETVRAMRSKPLIVTMLLTYTAVLLGGEAMWTAFQPFFASDGLEPEYIGLIFSVIAVFSAISSYSMRFIMRRIGVWKIELMVCLGILLSAFMLFLPSRTFHIAAVVPAALVFGMSLMPINAVAQKYVEGKFQSTALSIISLFQYVVYGVATIFVGISIDVFGVAASRRILLFEAVTVSIILFAVYISKHSVDEVISPKVDAVPGGVPAADVSLR
jgi:MFS family permease